MHRQVFGVVALLAAAQSPVLAQETTAAPAAAVMPAAPAAPVMRQIILPPNSEVVITPNDTLTTKGKQLKEGYKFRLSTMFDVMQDGYVVIPKGTMGEGTVTWMTNKGAFGKSGKMEVSFDWLDLGGKRVSLTGNHRQEGEGNTGATVGTAVAVGVFSAFVTGRSAEPLTFTVPDSAARVVAGTLVSTPVAAPAATAPVATPAS